MSAQVTRVIALCFVLVLLVAAAAAMLLREARRRELEGRAVQAASGAAAVPRASGSGVTAFLRRLGDGIRRHTRLYSPQDIEQLQGLILAAGYNPRQVLPIVIGAKLVMMVLAPALAAALAYLMVTSIVWRILVVVAGFYVGILGPDQVLGALRRPYIDALRRGMPEALDLLVICGEAGMGLESSLERVSGEMRRSNPAMAVVLSRLLDDLRVLPDRGQAFRNFGRRAGIEGLQRLGTMLGQSLQYGTPLSRALRAVALDLRRERMNELEEKAVRLPALLVFPVVLFIMPSLYIVLLGTSFLRLHDVLHGITTLLPVP
jgi:tight adherence protein C